MLPGKKLAVVVVCLFILCSAAVAGAVELSDIHGHWAEDEIRKLVGMGAITGYPDETYRPEGTITRVEFSSVVRGALGLEEAAGASFADITGHWGQGRIEALILAGVIDTGLYGQYYRPDGSITREEIAMMTVRMVGDLTGATEIPFIDATQISSGFNGYVAEAYARGIITGYPDDTFRPKGTASRAEAAVMAIRALRILDMTEEDVPTIVSFSSDLDSLIVGQTATLSWEVSGATAIAIDQNVGNVTPQGSLEISPVEITTYTLTATNNAGSSTAQVTITVTPFGDIILPPGFILPSPRITSFSADKSSMTEGISATLSWEVKGVAAVTIEPEIGEVSTSGSYSVSPSETTTYTLTASNVSATATETATIIVKPSLILQPGPGEGKDTYIYTFWKDSNFSVYSTCTIGNDSGGYTRRALLQFNDIENLPTNSVIVSADLYLYQRSTSGTGDFNISAHTITAPWGLFTVTWNTKIPFQATPESTSPVTAGANQWLSWDLKYLVQCWVNGSIPNHGVLLKKTNEGSGKTYITCPLSRCTDSPSLRPKLVIFYYIP